MNLSKKLAGVHSMLGESSVLRALTPREKNYLASRIHWGVHLPSEVIDGLKDLKDGRLERPDDGTFTSLCDSLFVLERHETIEGRRLYPDSERDAEVLLHHLIHVQTILRLIRNVTE